MKSLLQASQVPFELSPEAIDLYLHYFSIPDPMTPLKHVQKLGAGCLLVVDLRTWSIEEKPYWSIDSQPLQGDFVQAIQQELNTIAEIVVRSDVPVGIALSGGLDSSAIAALTSKRYPETMQAFSVGYTNQPPNDESIFAQQLAKQLGMPFHHIEISTQQMVNAFAEVVYWRDDLIADISGYGYYRVTQCAKEQGVRVLLMGHGGDELFWGYEWTRQAVSDNLKKFRGLTWRDTLQAMLATLPKTTNLVDWKNAIAMILKQTSQPLRDLEIIKQTPNGHLLFWNKSRMWNYARQHVPSLFVQPIADDNAYRPMKRSTTEQNLPIEITRMIMQLYMMQVGIAQGDRLGMANHVELRLPLVDYKLIETVIGHRKTTSDHHLPQKALFKRAIKDLLPEETLNRPKRGFEPPVREWSIALKQAYGQQLLDGYLVKSGLMNVKNIQNLLIQDNREALELVFSLLCLEMWCQNIRKPYVMPMDTLNA
jgi:asparagine synthase (glutamine-hydrolysing)